MRPVTSICGAFIILTLSQAQDTVTLTEVSEAMPLQIGVLIEFISTDAQTAFALAANDHQVPAREALTPMLAEGTANIEEVGYVITRSGTQTQVESIVELIYATEYHPARLPQSLAGPIEVADQIRTPATPTAYQTRNLGLTIKATPQVGPDRRLVELDLRLEQVEHIGDDTNGQLEALVTWPMLHSKDITNNFITESGKTTLIGFSHPRKRPHHDASSPFSARLPCLLQARSAA